MVRKEMRRLGLIYYGKRYLDPHTGAWTASDELKHLYPNMGSYVYCAGNPIKHIDPDGRVIWEAAILYYGAANTMENDTYSRKVHQVGYAMLHPINALSVGEYKQGSNNISTIASNFEINIVKAANLGVRKSGNYGNAFRHALWQAMITNEMGSDQAKRIGDAHEGHSNVNLNQRNFSNLEGANGADQSIDLLNNLIGRDIGEKNKGADNKTLALKVAEEFHNNGLWTAKGNEENGYTIQRTKLTDEQYKSVINEINKKGNNGKDK